MILRPQACLWAKLPPPLRFLQKVWSGGAGGLGWGAGGGVGEAEWLPRDTRDRDLCSPPTWLHAPALPSTHLTSYCLCWPRLVWVSSLADESEGISQNMSLSQPSLKLTSPISDHFQLSNHHLGMNFCAMYCSVSFPLVCI